MQTFSPAGRQFSPPAAGVFKVALSLMLGGKFQNLAFLARKAVHTLLGNFLEDAINFLLLLGVDLLEPADAIA